ncbi:MAG: hypothetical protein WAO52_07310 [Prolixibacteraceae bacterium]
MLTVLILAEYDFLVRTNFDMNWAYFDMKRMGFEKNRALVVKLSYWFN